VLNSRLVKLGLAIEGSPKEISKNQAEKLGKKLANALIKR